MPADSSVAVLLTRVELTGATGDQVIDGFSAAAAEDLGHDACDPPRGSRAARALVR